MGNRSRPNDRRHHWLGSFKLMFLLPGQEEVSHFEHNVTLTNKAKFVTANMIGEAQQAVQMHLLQEVKDPTIQMISCHIQGVHYLGEMSAEEFYTPPPVSEEAAPEGGTSEAAEPLTPVGVKDPFATKAAPVPSSDSAIPAEG
jgi:hypothetical protein